MKIDITIDGVTKSVDFTKPQVKIVERLLSGEKVTMINRHWVNGGEFVWYRKDGNYFGRECVGWKSYCNAMRRIRDAFGLGMHDYHFCEQWEIESRGI